MIGGEANTEVVELKRRLVDNFCGELALGWPCAYMCAAADPQPCRSSAGFACRRRERIPLSHSGITAASDTYVASKLWFILAKLLTAASFELMESTFPGSAPTPANPPVSRVACAPSQVYV